MARPARRGAAGHGALWLGKLGLGKNLRRDVYPNHCLISMIGVQSFHGPKRPDKAKPRAGCHRPGLRTPKEVSMSVASVPTSRPRRYARPGDGLSVTSATCTRTARKKVGDMTFQERCVDAVLRSESWVFTPVTADGDPIDGCYIQTPTHFKALEKLAAGEIAEGDVPAAYQADSMTCTCLSAHAPCPHVIALRHHFQRPNQLVVAALAMAEAVARHRDGAEEADAEPAERPSTLAELRARDGSMWD